MAYKNHWQITRLYNSNAISFLTYELYLFSLSDNDICNVNLTYKCLVFYNQFFIDCSNYLKHYSRISRYVIVFILFSFSRTMDCIHIHGLLQLGWVSISPSTKITCGTKSRTIKESSSFNTVLKDHRKVCKRHLLICGEESWQNIVQLIFETVYSL